MWNIESINNNENYYLKSLDRILWNLENWEVENWMFKLEEYFDKEEKKLMNEFWQAKDIYEIMQKESDLQDAIMISSVKHCLWQYNKKNSTSYKLEDIICIWADWWTWSKNVTPWASDFDYFFIVKNQKICEEVIWILAAQINPANWNNLKLPTRIWRPKFRDTETMQNLEQPTISFINLIEISKKILKEWLWKNEFINILKEIAKILLDKNSQWTIEIQSSFISITEGINSIFRNEEIQTEEWEWLKINNLNRIVDEVNIPESKMEYLAEQIFLIILWWKNWNWWAKSFSSIINSASSNRFVWWDKNLFIGLQAEIMKFYNKNWNNAAYLAWETYPHSLWLENRPQYFNLKEHVKRIFEYNLWFKLFEIKAKNNNEWIWVLDALKKLKNNWEIQEVEYNFLENSFRWLWELRMLVSIFNDNTWQLYYDRISRQNTENIWKNIENYYHTFVNLISSELYDWVNKLQDEDARKNHFRLVLDKASTVSNKLFLLEFIEQAKLPDFLKREQKIQQEVPSSFGWKIIDWKLHCEKQDSENELDYFIRVFDIVSNHWCDLDINTEKEVFRSIKSIFPEDDNSTISDTRLCTRWYAIDRLWLWNFDNNARRYHRNLRIIQKRLAEWISKENFWKTAFYLSLIAAMRKIIPWYWNTVWVEQWKDHFHAVSNETLRSLDMLNIIKWNKILKNLSWISWVKIINTALLLANISFNDRWKWENHWKNSSELIEKKLKEIWIRSNYASHEIKALKFYVENHHILMEPWIASAIVTWHPFAIDEIKSRLIQTFWEENYLSYVPWLIAVWLSTEMARQPLNFVSKTWKEKKLEETQEWKSVFTLLIELIHWNSIDRIENSHIWNDIAKQMSILSNNTITRSGALEFLKLYSEKNKKIWRKLINWALVKSIEKWEIAWYWHLWNIPELELIELIVKNIDYDLLKTEYNLLSNDKKTVWKFENWSTKIDNNKDITSCSIAIKMSSWSNALYRLTCLLSIQGFSIEKLNITETDNNCSIYKITISKWKINLKTSEYEQWNFKLSEIKDMLNKYCDKENNWNTEEELTEIATNWVDFKKFKPVRNLKVYFNQERKLLEIKWEDWPWIYVRLTKIFSEIWLKIKDASSITDTQNHQFFDVFEFEWNVPENFELLVYLTLSTKN